MGGMVCVHGREGWGVGGGGTSTNARRLPTLVKHS